MPGAARRPAAVALRVPLDPTSGARNDRFEAACDLDATGNLGPP
jgi:hypothetical protein